MPGKGCVRKMARLVFDSRKVSGAKKNDSIRSPGFRGRIYGEETYRWVCRLRAKFCQTRLFAQLAARYLLFQIVSYKVFTQLHSLCVRFTHLILINGRQRVIVRNFLLRENDSKLIQFIYVSINKPVFPYTLRI